MTDELKPNALISHYRIVSKIGSGGMGEVYRAIDTRLNREVAIKVLPSDFAKDEDRLQRFEQEAKATSALNQPNILTVYDIGEHNGSPFIVSELLEGGELRDRLNEGPIPIRKVIEYASQIVSGLSAAHERGIIHRDLKPENLFLTKDERVKILDFGLAKLREQKSYLSGSEDATRKAITSPGVVMGTVGYMSPEQVRGHTTDHRSDIFSFGVILYEMITGKRAFQHETMAETMSAILKDEPPEITDSNPNISSSLERITRRCLEKKPEHRFQSTADLRFALEALSSQTISSRELPPASSSLLPSKKKTPSWSLLVAAVLLTGIVVAIALRTILPRQSAAQKRMILNLAPPKQSTISAVATLASVIELSPDGSALLARASDGLYVRNLDSIDFYKVPATEDAGNQPFWNGPSTLTYLTTANNLVSVRLPDGPPEPDNKFHSVGYSRGGSWSDKGTLLLSMFNRLETRGTDGQSVVVENTTKREGKLLSPDFIPGSHDFLLYFRENGADSGEVWLATLAGNALTNVAILLKNETAARYTPAGGGRVLFVRNDNLYAQRLDRSSRALVGEPELVARGVSSQPAGSIAKADFSVSRNGVIAWRSGGAGTSQVAVFDRYGKLISTAGPSGDIDTVFVSPKDEKRILAIGDAGNRAFIAEVGQNGATEPGGTIDWLDWTSDGEKLVGFRGDEVYVRPVDGGQETVIGRFRYEDTTYFDISADGRTLLINCGLRGSLCVSSLTDDGGFGEPVPITNSKELEFDASFSPDGHSIVYAVRNGGVYVQPFPGPGRRQQISARGFDPVWRRDGKEILFAAESSIMSVSVSGTADSPLFAEPQKLFDNVRRSWSSVARSRGLGVSGDGSRIYWVQGAEQTEGSINVMFGFFDNEQERN